MYRIKKKISKKERALLVKKDFIDRNYYNKFMDHNGERGVVDIVDPQIISHYLCAICQQLDIQSRQNIINIQKSDFMTDRMIDLFKIVA